MGITISPIQKLLAIPEFRYKRAYLNKVEKIVNENLKTLNNVEFDLIRAMVFPVDKSWSPGNQLPKRIAKAIDTLLGNQILIQYYQGSGHILKEKLKEWNTLASLPKPEFARKVEGSGYITGTAMRVIKPYGISYYDFIDFCRLYEKTPVNNCVKKTIIAMKQKKWTGVITPRVCTFLLSGQEVPVVSGTKLREFTIG